MPRKPRRPYGLVAALRAKPLVPRDIGRYHPKVYPDIDKDLPWVMRGPDKPRRRKRP